MYDPWGELLSGTGDMATVPTNGAFRFQSDLTDSATGQVDMFTRLYEPTLGRFSSRDVLLGDPTTPLTLNQYVYGVGNPVTYTDPNGMRPECGDCSTRAEQEGLQVWADSQPTSSTTSEETPPPAHNQPDPDSIRPHVRAPNGCARRCGDPVEGLEPARWNLCSLPDASYNPITNRYEIVYGSPCLTVGISSTSRYTQTFSQVCPPIAGEFYATCVNGPVLTKPDVPDPGEESIGRFLEQGETTGWIEFGPGSSGRIRKAIAIVLTIVILAAVAHGQSIEDLPHGEHP